MRNSAGLDKLTLYGPSGSIDMQGTLSLTGSSANHDLKVYGNAASTFRILLGANSGSVAEVFNKLAQLNLCYITSC